MGGPRSNKRTDNRGRLLYNFIMKYDLVPVNLGLLALGPINTHYGPTGDTCIDYIMVPATISPQVRECMVLDYAPLNTSDHVPVGVVLETGGIPKGVTQENRASRTRWDKMTPEMLNNMYKLPLGRDLDNLYRRHEGLILDEAGIEGLLAEIIVLVKRHERAVPKSRYKCNVKPYWCPELNALKREKVQAYRNWCGAGRPRDPQSPEYIANKQAKNLFRKRIKRISREYDESKIEEAIKSAELNHSVFWKLLKREKDGPKIKSPSIKTPGGAVVHDVDDILRVWEGHFSMLGTPVESEKFDREHYRQVNDAVTGWLNMTQMCFQMPCFQLKRLEGG